MVLSFKTQYLLSVIEKTIKQAPNTSRLQRCNIPVGCFDSIQLAHDFLKKYGSELEKYSVTQIETVECSKIRL